MMNNNFECNDIRKFVKETGLFEKFYAIEKYNGNEKKVIIPEEYDGFKVCEIGRDSFKGNKNIEEIELSKYISNIESGAFSNCVNLRSINLENVEYIDVNAFSSSGIESAFLYNVKEINLSAFNDCEKLEEVVIGDGIKEIKNSSFVNCKNMKKLILPDSLEKIGDNAFSGCKKISEIVISDNTKASKYAFEKNVIEIIKNKKKGTKSKTTTYNLEYLIKETKKMKKEEIEKYIKELLKEHKLDQFDPSDITVMNNIGFNKENGELNWNCTRCGNCTCNLFDLLVDKGKMIENFDISGCGYCK